MSRQLIYLVTITICLSFTIGTAYARPSAKVKAYQRKGGKHIAAHQKTAPDRNRYNNYGTKGNINPATGTVGRKNPNFVEKKI